LEVGAERFSMPRVYIPNKTHHDVSSAVKYGELVVLTEGTMNRYKVHDLARVFEEGLSDSAPDDFLMVSGLPIVVGICSAYFAAKHGRVNYLLWNGQSYDRREIVFGERYDRTKRVAGQPSGRPGYPGETRETGR
jgi:hypothetical protein